MVIIITAITFNQMPGLHARVPFELRHLLVELFEVPCLGIIFGRPTTDCPRWIESSVKI